MSPRPKKATDDEVFAAAFRVIQQVTPAQLTLSRIAAEAGVTAGALVQRFGSKRQLLLTLFEKYAEASGGMWGQLRSGHKSPIAAIYAYAECIAALGETPGALAHHLSYMQLDLTDPDFHRHARAQAVATQATLREWVREGMERGELKVTDADALARLITTTATGSLINWGFFRDGSAREWLRTDLDLFLREYLVEQRP